jgi:predicted transcriptional regulator
MKLNKNDEKVVATLNEAKHATLAELTEKTGLPSKKVFKSLKKLFEHELIDSQGRKYRLLSAKVPASKGNEEDDAPEDE